MEIENCKLKIEKGFLAAAFFQFSIFNSQFEVTMRAPALLLLLAFAAPAFGASHTECATGPATSERVRELDAWAAARERQLLAKGLPAANAVAGRNGVFVVEADELNAPFRRPFDLEGQTLLLQRRDSTTYTASVVPLAFDEDAGAQVALAGVTSSAAVSLGFDFPF